jgi:hypothetical protein
MPTLSEFLRSAAKDDRFADVCRNFFEPTNFLCPVHNKPIEVIDCYYSNAFDITPTAAVHRASKGNPHHLDIYHSTDPTDFHTEPKKMVICPECEANYRESLNADRDKP